MRHNDLFHTDFFKNLKITGALCATLITCLALGGCHSLFGKDSDDATHVQGKRIPVLAVSKKASADTDLSDFTIELPAPDMSSDWPQAGGNANHALSNALIGPSPQKIWKSSIGHGTGGDYRLLASPIVAEDRVFTMDSRGRVTAFSVKNGERLWKFDTTPKDRDTEAVGGGVAFEKGIVYATSGFGEILALRAQDGQVVWRKLLGKPLRSPPTVDSDRVYVVSIDNELTAISTKDGQILWHHNGIVESATLMGASSPAIDGDSIVVAYSSGEVFNLRAQNGRVSWSEILASPAQVGALPAIADIRGLPIISQNAVYAISHSDRMGAIDLRTGERIWEADVGGVNTPALAENALYVISNDNQLVALTRKTGRILWVVDLPRYKNPEDKDSDPVQWWGPVLAGGRLWMTNSIGQLASFATDDGINLTLTEVADHFFMPPIIADNVMYLLDDDGSLYAMK